MTALENVDLSEDKKMERMVPDVNDYSVITAKDSIHNHYLKKE